MKFILMPALIFYKKNVFVDFNCSLAPASSMLDGLHRPDQFVLKMICHFYCQCRLPHDETRRINQIDADLFYLDAMYTH